MTFPPPIQPIGHNTKNKNTNPPPTEIQYQTINLTPETRHKTRNISKNLPLTNQLQHKTLSLDEPREQPRIRKKRKRKRQRKPQPLETTIQTNTINSSQEAAW